MLYFLIKEGVEYEQGALRSNELSSPSSMFGAIVLACANNDCVVTVDLLFPLRPISQELRLSLVSQGVIEQLIDNLEWHGGNVSSDPGRFNDMNRMTKTCGQHFCLPLVVLVDLHYFLKQYEPVLANVVQTPEKGTDKRGSGLGSENRLRCREA